MLARLEQMPGIAAIAADQSGEHLRVELASSSQDAQVIDALAAQGVEVEAESVVIAAQRRWYDARSARELSRIESEVLAREAVPPFVREHGIRPETADRLERLVRDQLYAAFSEHTLGPGPAPREFMQQPIAAIAVEAETLLGSDLAERLRQDLDDRWCGRR